VFGNVRELRPAGVSSAMAGETLYLCPAARRCSRSRWPAPAVGPPQCEITSLPMRRERL
jgi:hypothetical protein